MIAQSLNAALSVQTASLFFILFASEYRVLLHLRDFAILACDVCIVTDNMLKFIACCMRFCNMTIYTTGFF